MLDVIDLAHFPVSAFGRPAVRGWNETTSARLTRVCPPTTRLFRRPFRTSFEIAWRDTPRSCAASAWEIHSDGEIRSWGKLVDKVNLLSYHRFWYRTSYPCRLTVLTEEDGLGQTPAIDDPTALAPV